MLFPIRTDSPIKRTPWVNYGIIAANVVVFFLSHDLAARVDPTTGHRQTIRDWIFPFLLDGADPKLYQFLTYQFLHGDFAHILGNMVFLWVFGNSVNGKMGHGPYLLFYLAGGVFAATGYALFKPSPMLGASGAIAAVTTAYLALFPRSNIEFIYWWFFIGFIELPSVFMIVLKMILWDNVIAPNLSGPAGLTQVAYGAHLAGYLFGFVAALLLLSTRALPRDQFDIVALWRRWYHRQSLAGALRDPTARARAQYGRVARPVTVPTARPAGPASAEPTDHLADLRARISRALAARDRVTAAELYQELLAADPNQALAREQQLEVAYQLYQMGRMPQAAQAYERYVQNYSTAGDVDQVKLLLGIIFARDLHQFEAARKHLTDALARLSDEKRRQQCREWLDVVNEAIGGSTS
jgi:membrane associated rhomboid family serine protease